VGCGVSFVAAQRHLASPSFALHASSVVIDCFTIE
jgi:hypothetical protein